MQIYVKSKLVNIKGEFEIKVLIEIQCMQLQQIDEELQPP